MAVTARPNGITLYPGQSQSISLRTAGTPLPSWSDMTNGTMNSSRALVYSGSGGYVEGGGLNRLWSSGRVSFTLTNANFPSSTGTLRLQITSLAVTGHFLRLDIASTGVITATTKAPDYMRWTDGSGTLGAAASVPADGTEYSQTKPGALGTMVAAVGQTLAFDISLNGIVVTGMGGMIEWTSVANPTLGGSFIPPFYYYTKIMLPVTSGTATMAAPVLEVADWRPGSSTSWAVAPSSAYVTLSSSGSGLYENTVNAASNAQPGKYAITVAQQAVGGLQLDDLEIPVQVPTFLVNSATSIELAPSEKRAFSTSYDNQTGVTVTPSATSGTFAGMTYTAPSSSGTATLTFTSGNQTRTVAVTITAELTPTYTYVEPSEVIALTCTMSGTLTWSLSPGGGSLSASSGSAVSWTVPNTYGVNPVLTITNGSETITRTYTTAKKFPYSPHVDTNYSRTKPVVVSVLEDGTTYGRVKSANGVAKDEVELNFRNRETDELEAVIEFIDEHEPHKRFIFANVNRGTRAYVRIVPGSFRNSDIVAGLVNYSFSVTEW
jgi:hypothetical protein